MMDTIRMTRAATELLADLVSHDLDVIGSLVTAEAEDVDDSLDEAVSEARRALGEALGYAPS